MAILEIKVPTVGESITEVTIANWVKNNGDYVNLDDLLCEIESDKATFELNAEQSGTLTIVAQAGDTVNIGDVIAKIDTSASAPASSPTPKQEIKQEATQGTVVVQNTNYATGHPSPTAAKILDEKGIPSTSVNGTGKDGRITKDDALNASPIQQNTKQTTPTPSPVVSLSTERAESREKMSQLRKTIAKRLVEVKNQTAMLTTFNEVDMSALMEMRKKYKEIFKEKHNIGLGFMSLFTKAVCEALKEFPAVNGMIDGTDIVYHNYCDVGIAVSAPKGLMVPVVRDADKLSLADIEKAIASLAAKARDGKLSIDEMQGGTFTITNGGVFGSLMSTPIINAPQSAILGMHNIVERPIALNGQVVIRPMMYVALSYDHRIIDGRESVSFLVRVKQMLEDPYRLLLEV